MMLVPPLLVGFSHCRVNYSHNSQNILIPSSFCRCTLAPFLVASGSLRPNRSAIWSSLHIQHIGIGNNDQRDEWIINFGFNMYTVVWVGQGVDVEDHRHATPHDFGADVNLYRDYTHIHIIYVYLQHAVDVGQTIRIGLKDNESKRRRRGDETERWANCALCWVGVFGAENTARQSFVIHDVFAQSTQWIGKRFAWIVNWWLLTITHAQRELQKHAAHTLLIALVHRNVCTMPFHSVVSVNTQSLSACR